MTRPKKRSFSIKGHRTSLSLEAQFWDALRELASNRDISLAQLVAEVDATRGDVGLSTAMRLHILEHFRATAAASD